MLSRWHLAELDPLEKQALFCIADRDRWSRFSTLCHGPNQAKIKFTLKVFARAMAIKAVCPKDWTNIFLECQLITESE